MNYHNIEFSGDYKMKNTKNLQGKNIVIYFPTFEMGGAERQAIYLANHLKFVRGANVKVLANYPLGAASVLLSQLNIPWMVFPLPEFDDSDHGWENILKFIIKFKKLKAELLLTFTFHPNIFFNMVWEFTGAKACIWNQADAGTGFGFSQKTPDEFYIFSTGNSLYNFVSNSSEGKLFLEGYQKEEIKVKLIHNGTKLERPINTRREWRSKLRIHESSFVAIKIANLTKAKDHKTIVNAWKLVIDNWKSKEMPILIFAGRLGETYESLKSLVIDLNLERNVIFLGHVNDIAGVLIASDVGVFSSISEGIPNGVLECMLAKLPVIATDLMGVREALGDDEGFLVSIKNSHSFAEKILMLANKPMEIQKKGQENFNRVRSMFSLDKMLSEYDLLIDNLLL